MTEELYKKYNLSDKAETHVFKLHANPSIRTVEKPNYGGMLSQFGSSYTTGVPANFPYVFYNYVVYNRDLTQVHMAFVTEDNYKTGKIQITEEFYKFCENHRSSYLKAFVRQAIQSLASAVYYGLHPELMRLNTGVDSRNITEYTTLPFSFRRDSSLPLREYDIVSAIGNPPEPLPVLKFKSLSDIERFDALIKEHYLGTAPVVSEPAKVEVVEMDDLDRRMLGLSPEPLQEHEGEEDEDWDGEESYEEEEETVAIVEEQSIPSSPMPPPPVAVTIDDSMFSTTDVRP
jgi:hypothetical protein